MNQVYRSCVLFANFSTFQENQMFLNYQRNNDR